MMRLDTPFAKAIEALLRKVSDELFAGQLPEAPVPVVVAGGAAVHLYTGMRVSKDLDLDRADVRGLVQHGLLNLETFERLAREALSYYVGNVTPVHRNLSEALALFPEPGAVKGNGP